MTDIAGTGTRPNKNDGRAVRSTELPPGGADGPPGNRTATATATVTVCGLRAAVCGPQIRRRCPDGRISAGASASSV